MAELNKDPLFKHLQGSFASATAVHLQVDGAGVVAVLHAA